MSACQHRNRTGVCDLCSDKLYENACGPGWISQSVLDDPAKGWRVCDDGKARWFGGPKEVSHEGVKRERDELRVEVRRLQADYAASRELLGNAQSRGGELFRENRQLEGRVAELEAGIQNALILCDVEKWTPTESRDSGEVFPADIVRDLVDDTRRSLLDTDNSS